MPIQQEEINSYKKYIRNQLREDQITDQMRIRAYADLFAGD